MEKKLYNKDCITLDGRLDEPVWETVQEYTGFRKAKLQGGEVVKEQTFFKIIPYEDRIYIGVKCMEPDMAQVIESHSRRSIWETDRMEFYISPSGRSLDFYQFVVTFGEASYTCYYIEEGRTVPGPFKPEWHYATYAGEDFWSLEIELPLTAFYMTPNESWSDTWAISPLRGRTIAGVADGIYTTWAEIYRSTRETDKFPLVSGFPIRAPEDDLRIDEAIVTITEEKPDGYRGIMKVRTTGSEGGTFDFASDHGDSITVELDEGTNEFTVPCYFEELNRYQVSLELTRKRDGKRFKVYYPVRVTYEPIKLQFTLPEYRCNFYPGQDYSKIAGKVTAEKTVTLKLEGPGIETTVISPEADGSFTFATPNFREGEAWLTATIEDYEIKQKIRRLAPTGHTMSWISGGNLVVNGKPVLRRNLYAAYYRGGTAFQRKYDADDLHETKNIISQKDWIQPCELIKGSEAPGGEATQHRRPSEAMLRKIDERIEANKDRDFVYYYPSDEPECRRLSPVYMKHYCDYIADKDPYHVMLMASRSPDTLVDYVDWVETHPYINARIKEDGTRDYSRPLYTVGDFVDKVSKLNRPDKCIGFLPTCFASPGYSGSDYVTLDEYILHTWAAMIRGGKSIWPYAYHDVNDRASLYEGTRYIFSSFEALEDIILFGKRTTLTKSTTAEAVLYEHGEEKLFALLNFTQQPQTVTLESLTGEWHEFRGSRVFTGKTFELKPQETIVATNVIKGENLPTYAQTAALIDKLEYQRTHTGSLLFNRFLDINITTSGAWGLCRWKLFDGVPDNLACIIRENPDNFIELDLSKVRPAFAKVVVKGYCLETARLKVKLDDVWIAPAIAEESTEEFAKTFILQDAVSPNALRLEFMGRQVELYEIALF